MVTATDLKLSCNVERNREATVTFLRGFATSTSGFQNHPLSMKIIMSNLPLTVTLRFSLDGLIVYFEFSMDLDMTDNQLSSFITIENGMLFCLEKNRREGRLIINPVQFGRMIVTIHQGKITNAVKANSIIHYLYILICTPLL